MKPEEIEQTLDGLYPVGSVFMSLSQNNSFDKIFGKWRYLGVQYGAHCWVRTE
jgi:hypothetical protein